MSDSKPHDVWSQASKQISASLGITFNNGEIELTKGSISKSFGGWLGISETILPTIIFILVYQLTSNVFLAVGLSGGLSLIALIRQLIVKSALTQAVVGVLSIGLTIWLTLRDNNASDFFLQGLITNSAYLLVALISLAVRWPIVGLVVGFVIGEGFAWRSKRAHFNRFALATAIYCSMYLIRLSVEVPLYLASNLSALGAAKLILGIPLYAVTLWVMWLVVKPLIRRAS